MVVLCQYLVSEKTPICLKHHRSHEPEKYLKKKKIILCRCFSSHLITIQIHEKPVPPSASITSSVPITAATSNFIVQRHHDNDPAFRLPSAHLLQSMPDNLRQLASPILILVSFAPPEALHLVHHYWLRWF